MFIIKELMYETDELILFHNLKHTLVSVPEMLSAMSISLSSC